MGRSINSFTQWVNGEYTIGGRNKTPEENLFNAVLSQAVHDVFSAHVERIHKTQAIHFLTNDSQNLRMVCEIAGRNPDYVRTKIRKKLLREGC